MKAISLWQPWASLMVSGLKKIETRSWATNYRGPLLIHAALKELPGLGIIGNIPRGGIIGSVDLIDCQGVNLFNRPDYPERDYGDYTAGRFMWITENPKAFKKIIPYKGRQRIFNIPDEVLRVCRVCGCSEFNVCDGGCCWVGEDLCSACSPEMTKSNVEILAEMTKGIDKKPCGCSYHDGKQIICCSRHNEIFA